MVDGIIVRNSGPVIHYLDQYEAFLRRCRSNGTPVYNSLDGKADMLGKQYLVDLYEAAYPVIPTIRSINQLEILPQAERYVMKPANGADSIGMTYVTHNELQQVGFSDVLVQPEIDFLYEVSFYFIDGDFQYACYAPSKDKRWELEHYECGMKDLEFAQAFVDWNSMSHGIQRVDACRTQSGELLLVELEDLNPFLSLLDLDSRVRQRFVKKLIRSLEKAFPG